jgi:repressor LexA
MSTPPTPRQKEIAAFLDSEFSKRGMMPTQQEITDYFRFASRNSTRSHLRLMEKKGMLDRIPRKARGLKLKRQTFVGIPLVAPVAAGNPRTAFQDGEEVIPVSAELFRGSDLFALRVIGDSMKDAGILPGDIAVMNRQQDVADGEIAAVLLEDDATLKYLHRQDGTVVLRGANSAFPDITIRGDSARSVRIIGKYVGLIRSAGSTR